MYRGISPEEQSCVLLGRAGKLPDYEVFLSVGFFLKNSLVRIVQEDAGGWIACAGHVSEHVLQMGRWAACAQEFGISCCWALCLISVTHTGL